MSVVAFKAKDAKVRWRGGGGRGFHWGREVGGSLYGPANNTCGQCFVFGRNCLTHKVARRPHRVAMGREGRSKSRDGPRGSR